MDKIEYFPDRGVMDLSYFPYYGRLAQVSKKITQALKNNMITKKCSVKVRLHHKKVHYKLLSWGAYPLINLF